MSIPVVVELAAFGLMAGLLIGCIGIGGVILVPALVYFAGYSVPVAISMAMLGYVMSGAIGTLAFAARKSIRWDMVGALWLGAVPAAFAGALAANIAPPQAIELAIAVLTLASGARALLSSAASDQSGREASSVSAAALGGTGVVTGFLSSLTGTGGPLVLVPILVALQLPVLTAIGLSQTIQLPIALFATAGNAYAGNLHVLPSLWLGVALAAGTWGGAKLAHSVPRELLRRAVSVVLIAIGCMILARLAMSFGR